MLTAILLLALSGAISASMLWSAHRHPLTAVDELLSATDAAIDAPVASDTGRMAA